MLLRKPYLKTLMNSKTELITFDRRLDQMVIVTNESSDGWIQTKDRSGYWCLGSSLQYHWLMDWRYGVFLEAIRLASSWTWEWHCQSTAAFLNAGELPSTRTAQGMVCGIWSHDKRSAGDSCSVWTLYVIYSKKIPDIISSKFLLRWGANLLLWLHPSAPLAVFSWEVCGNTLHCPDDNYSFFFFINFISFPSLSFPR